MEFRPIGTVHAGESASPIRCACISVSSRCPHDYFAPKSFLTHIDKLEGKLMLVVGELDHNVDPASTAQVVAARQRAGQNFDYLPIMNAGHGAAATPYGKYRRAEFLVRHLRAGE